MVATRGAGIVAADRCDRGTVGKINRPALHLGFALQLGVVLDDAFHGLEHAGKGLLEVIGEHKHFVRCFLSESPRQGQGAVERGFAALLDAANRRSCPMASCRPDRRQRRVSTLRVDGR